MPQGQPLTARSARRPGCRLPPECLAMGPCCTARGSASRACGSGNPQAARMAWIAGIVISARRARSRPAGRGGGQGCRTARSWPGSARHRHAIRSARRQWVPLRIHCPPRAVAAVGSQASALGQACSLSLDVCTCGERSTPPSRTSGHVLPFFACSELWS